MASGSKGNATYIEHNQTKILIDAGISFKRMKEAMQDAGFDIYQVTHVFITHEHVDHIKGMDTLYKNINAPIYTSAGTAKAMSYYQSTVYQTKIRIVEPLEEFYLDDLTIIPFPLSHDARDPIGFILKTEDKKIAYITDTGYIREGLIPLLSNADLYYMEANHDPYLLKNSPRPFHTIKRILTEKGHLSNEDSAYYFSQMMGTQTKTLIMAHISDECNTNDIIKRTYEDVLIAHQKDLDTLEVHYASQVPLKVIEL
ncbi:(Metallo-beta-lactamase domain protein) [Paracholeplasma brassicae]|uniref:(Metallo-beta-lactamase domain protein) n=1 Tax=Acholeplasma brassicae TaxID=61635 RepID=U4KMI1_9MOLU|nr:MBL fold metallo-hydrolase [Paracholeplasma brassicae]CCV65362.1 (Metallo-beta-lactamase domain protein) [Paracholeplasma brassicae]